MIRQTERISCRNEYDTLAKVIMCPPRHMEIKEIINETQKFFAAENIDSDLAYEQHRSLIQTLEKNNVEVIQLPPDKKFPEQVFTRDIGFAVGKMLFLANLKRNIRKQEEEILRKWLTGESLTYHRLEKGTIEGGDVLVDGSTVLVGDSDRTSGGAIAELGSMLTAHEVVAVPFAAKYLHLDCVFNIIAPGKAIIFPPAFERKELKYLVSRYDCIEVSAHEQFTLGTNVLSIGQKKVISLPQNKEVNVRLVEWGFQVIEVNISEIIKSGGSFRCITLPLLRFADKK